MEKTWSNSKGKLYILLFQFEGNTFEPPSNLVTLNNDLNKKPPSLFMFIHNGTVLLLDKNQMKGKGKLLLVPSNDINFTSGKDLVQSTSFFFSDLSLL